MVPIDKLPHPHSKYLWLGYWGLETRTAPIDYLPPTIQFARLALSWIVELNCGNRLGPLKQEAQELAGQLAGTRPVGQGGIKSSASLTEDCSSGLVLNLGWFSAKKLARFEL